MVQDTHSCSQHCLVLEQVGLERAVNMKWWTSSCTNLNSSTACFRIVDEELKALIPARLARLVLHWALLCVVTDGDACKHIPQWVRLVAELSANSQNSCKKTNSRWMFHCNFHKQKGVTFQLSPNTGLRLFFTYFVFLSVLRVTYQLWNKTHTNTHPFNGPFSGTTQVSRYEKDKNQSGFYWSKRQWVAVASAGPYASLHLAPDRQPHQHPTTLFFTGRMPFLLPNQQRQGTEGKLWNKTVNTISTNT